MMLQWSTESIRKLVSALLDMKSEHNKNVMNQKVSSLGVVTLFILLSDNKNKKTAPFTREQRDKKYTIKEKQKVKQLMTEIN